MEALLTITEAAERLRLKPSTIRAWILGKRIQYAKVGRRVFIRAKDLDQFVCEALVPVRTGR
jgi:excisionase family DNA binding protein